MVATFIHTTIRKTKGVPLVPLRQRSMIAFNFLSKCSDFKTKQNNLLIGPSFRCTLGGSFYILLISTNKFLVFIVWATLDLLPQGLFAASDINLWQPSSRAPQTCKSHRVYPFTGSPGGPCSEPLALSLRSPRNLTGASKCCGIRLL